MTEGKIPLQLWVCVFTDDSYAAYMLYNIPTLLNIVHIFRGKLHFRLNDIHIKGIGYRIWI